MTNQQGAPEALRLADALQAVEEGWSIADKCCAELRRLHAENERLAALVEAQQPAPSAAAATEVESLRKALQFYADKDHFNIADEGAWDTVSGEPQNYWCDEEGTATVEDGTIARLALAGHPIKFDADEAPQPSPTPQADSASAGRKDDTADEHPAARRMREDFEREYGRHHPIASALRRYYDTRKGYDDAWNRDREKPVTLDDVLKTEREVFSAADRAARAPADSVTAPAGGAVARVLLDSSGKPMLRPQLLDEEFLADPEAFDSMYPHRAPHRIANLYATPPAQAADNELEDALIEALELGLECAMEVAANFHEAYKGHRPHDHAAVDADVGKIKSALDAARKQGANQ